MLLEKIFPGLINQKTKFLVKNHGLKKYVKTIIYGVIIPTLFQVRRINAVQNLFQANMLFPTIFGIKIRNLVFFLHTEIMFFRKFEEKIIFLKIIIFRILLLITFSFLNQIKIMKH